MTATTLRSVAVWAVALLVLGAGTGTVVAGPDFGAGMAAGGLVVLSGFGLSSFLARIWLERKDTLAGRLAQVALLFKMPVLIATVWWLFHRFDVLAVVLGASVLVLAITFDAVRVHLRSLSTGASFSNQGEV